MKTYLSLLILLLAGSVQAANQQSFANQIVVPSLASTGVLASGYLYTTNDVTVEGTARIANLKVNGPAGISGSLYITNMAGSGGIVAADSDGRLMRTNITGGAGSSNYTTLSAGTLTVGTLGTAASWRLYAANSNYVELNGGATIDTNSVILMEKNGASGVRVLQSVTTVTIPTNQAQSIPLVMGQILTSDGTNYVGTNYGFPLNFPPNTGNVVMVFGTDSITAGNPPTSTYPQFLFAGFTNNGVVYPGLPSYFKFGTNAGVAGQTVAEADVNYPVDFAPWKPGPGTNVSGIAFLLGGINDFAFNATAETTFTHYTNWARQCHADKFKVVGFTCQTYATITPQQDMERIRYNDMIRASSCWDYLYDFARNTPPPWNSVWYRDHIHPSDFGFKWMAWSLIETLKRGERSLYNPSIFDNSPQRPGLFRGLPAGVITSSDYRGLGMQVASGGDFGGLWMDGLGSMTFHLATNGASIDTNAPQMRLSQAALTLPPGGIIVFNADVAVAKVWTATNANGSGTWSNAPAGGASTPPNPISGILFNSNGVMQASANLVFTNGFTGIGNPVPQSMLSISNNTAAANSLRVMSSNNPTPAFQIASNGAVSIGTASFVSGAALTLAGGKVLFLNDNTDDFGAVGGNRAKNAYIGGTYTAGSAGYYQWTSRSAISSPADGVILFQNSATTDLGRIQLGGTTAAFPAIGRTNGDLIIGGGDTVYAGLATNRLWVPGGIVNVASKIFTQTNTVIVTNTTTSSALLSGAGVTNIPANVLGVGSVIRINLFGNFWTPGAPVGTTLTLRVLLGGVVLCQTPVIAPPAAQAAQAWQIKWEAVVRSPGATAIIAPVGMMQYGGGVLGGGPSYGMPLLNSMLTTNVNTTAAISISVDATFNNTTDADSIACTGGTIEIIP